MKLDSNCWSTLIKAIHCLIVFESLFLAWEPKFETDLKDAPEIFSYEIECLTVLKLSLEGKGFKWLANDPSV